MKLKYYLRGLGIGIIVTALLMGFATKDKGVMSDEEVKARALKLGMVEQRTLADMRDNEYNEDNLKEERLPVSTTEPEEPSEEAQRPEVEPTEQPLETQEPEVEPTEQPLETQEPEVEPTEPPLETQEPEVEPTEPPLETQEPEGESTELPVETEKPDTEPERIPVEEDLQQEIMTIQVIRGDSSLAVSKKLEQMGLIKDAEAYDRYLCKNGFDRKLNIGIYEIVKGMSEEEITKIITRTN